MEAVRLNCRLYLNDPLNLNGVTVGVLSEHVSRSVFPSISDRTHVGA